MDLLNFTKDTRAGAPTHKTGTIMESRRILTETRIQCTDYMLVFQDLKCLYIKIVSFYYHLVRLKLVTINLRLAQPKVPFTLFKWVLAGQTILTNDHRMTRAEIAKLSVDSEKAKNFNSSNTPIFSSLSASAIGLTKQM